jgi:hypothetical protein
LASGTTYSWRYRAATERRARRQAAEDQDGGGHQGDGKGLDQDPGHVVGEPAEDLGDGHPLQPPRPGVEEAEEEDGREEEEGEEEDGEAFLKEVAVEGHGSLEA